MVLKAEALLPEAGMDILPRANICATALGPKTRAGEWELLVTAFPPMEAMVTGSAAVVSVGCR